MPLFREFTSLIVQIKLALFLANKVSFKFTSLIVQIKQKVNIYWEMVNVNVYIPHSSDKTIAIAEKNSQLHPVYIPHSSDKTTPGSGKSYSALLVYIPHSSDKTLSWVCCLARVGFVYIPHSSDKTKFDFSNFKSIDKFTSLIVQIKPTLSPTL